MQIVAVSNGALRASACPRFPTYRVGRLVASEESYWDDAKAAVSRVSHPTPHTSTSECGGMEAAQCHIDVFVSDFEYGPSDFAC